MAALCTRVKVMWKDRYNQQASIVFHIAAGVVDPSDARVLAIIVAIENVCRAKAVRIELSQVNSIAGTITASAAYRSVDKALMNGIDQDGQAHNWKIPGLKTTILLSDKETIDLSNAFVAAWVTAVTTSAVGRGGSTITAITDGHRTTNRKQLKR